MAARTTKLSNGDGKLKLVGMHCKSVILSLLHDCSLKPISILLCV